MGRIRQASEARRAKRPVRNEGITSARLCQAVLAGFRPDLVNAGHEAEA